MGRVVATIGDVKFAGKFGYCGILEKPCDYTASGPWSRAASGIQFGGLPPLVQGATLRCKHGAEISVIEVGQTTIYAGRPDEVQLQAYAEMALSDNQCSADPSKNPSHRFDATYVANDGTTDFHNNVTQAELDEYEKRDDINTMYTEMDRFLADPPGYELNEAISGAVTGAARTVEERARLQRTGVPTKARR